MIIQIYCLKNPKTKEIVYVSQTPKELKQYLKSKYWKLNEVKRGGRNWTKLFKYMNDLLPLRLEIEILTQIDTDTMFGNPDFYESYYIKKYKKINPNLLNETDGGRGGNTIKYKTNEEKIEIGRKISKKLKGKPKPPGFAEHLKEIRLGKNNPMSKKLNKIIGMFDKNNNMIASFQYAYEIDDYLNSKYAAGNIIRYIKKSGKHCGYGHIWKYIE